ncbi:hypothetical protein DPMN_080938 [Dreissena polymorpha]|uniref:Uncharacterized protein n=1 Tax=Dreissena polymorpha TaxID=45954 RepID=A0A9D4BFI0_DREPO|nr:hypothetical protein DPMN_080938 [Dreissena polymorpha]
MQGRGNQTRRESIQMGSDFVRFADHDVYNSSDFVDEENVTKTNLQSNDPQSRKPLVARSMVN